MNYSPLQAARVYTKKLSYLFFHTATSSMDFIASSVQGIISITPKIEIIGTTNVNLQSLGLFVPSTANWLIDAAPYQHHNLRQSVNVTSLPFFFFQYSVKYARSVCSNNYFFPNHNSIYLKINKYWLPSTQQYVFSFQRARI